MKAFKVWRNKKYNASFKGSYERDSKGERVFVLTGKLSSGKNRRITFESFQAAKKLGWYLA